MIQLEFDYFSLVDSTQVFLILTRIMNDVPIWIASKCTLIAEFLFANRTHFHFSQE